MRCVFFLRNVHSHDRFALTVVVSPANMLKERHPIADTKKKLMANTD